MSLNRTKLCSCGSRKKFNDCCGIKPHAATSARLFYSSSFFWLPTALFLVVAAYEIILATNAHDYPWRACEVHQDVLRILSLGCFSLAGLLTIIPPLRRALARHLDKFAKADLKTHLVGVVCCFLGVLTWLSFIKFCQYRLYLLPIDTANDINAAYTFIHHGVLEFSIWRCKLLSIHFTLLPAVFSPFLLICNSPLTLLFRVFSKASG